MFHLTNLDGGQNHQHYLNDHSSLFHYFYSFIFSPFSYYTVEFVKNISKK
jgi:hypothetical protein